MSERFRERYKIESNRMFDWSYARNGFYFITLVTYSRQCLFGRITDGKMISNDLGQIVSEEFYKSFKIRQELVLDGFVLMPNHIHAIVVIKRLRNITMDCDNGLDCKDARTCVSTFHQIVNFNATIPQSIEQKEFTLFREPQSISSFIAGFKSATVRKIDDWIENGNHNDGLILQKFNRRNPLWHPNYHDHIIRNTGEYLKIRDYINNNPMKWEQDCFMKQ